MKGTTVTKKALVTLGLPPRIAAILIATTVAMDEDEQREVAEKLGKLNGVTDVDVSDRHTIEIRLSPAYASQRKAAQIAENVLNTLGLKLQGKMEIQRSNFM